MKYYGGEKNSCGKKAILPSALKPITPHYGIYHFFFTLHPSLESSRLLICREGNIKQPKLSLIRGVLLVNLHQRCASETVFLGTGAVRAQGKVPRAHASQESLNSCLKRHLHQLEPTINSFCRLRFAICGNERISS